MNISVIVPTLHDDVLPRTIEAILNQNPLPFEIIIVGLFDANLIDVYPSVHFVSTQVPVCAAKARNTGIAQATGDVFLFTDSDCIPAPDWVGRHQAGQIAGHLVLGGGVDIDDENYWARSDNVSMFHEFSTVAIAGTRFLIPTLNASVHRTVYDRVGGMDESFPGAAGEDTDWTIRMRLAGYTLDFDPSIVVAHRPVRLNWKRVARHWFNAGYNNMRPRFRYPSEYNMPKFTKSALFWRLLSPLIGVKITWDIYKQAIYRPYWASLPVVYATKVVYCWGAARSLDDGFVDPSAAEAK